MDAVEFVRVESATGLKDRPPSVGSVSRDSNRGLECPPLPAPLQVKGTGQDAGYVYAYGTPNGRNGSARLARFTEVDFPDWSKATYWDGSDWSSEVSEATTVLDGRVSELSVQYNAQRRSWLAMYESTEGIVLREAASPTGPWGPKKTVVSRAQVPDIYGAFILPNQAPTPTGSSTSWPPAGRATTPP